MKYIFLVFCVVCMVGSAHSNILSTIIIPGAQFTIPSFTFYFLDQLVVGYDAYNNVTVGHSPFITMYNLKGQSTKTMTIPVNCTLLNCSTRTKFVNFQGTTLTLQACPDYSCTTWYFFSIDISSLSILHSRLGSNEWGFPLGFISLPTFPSLALTTQNYNLLSFVNLSSLSLSNPIQTIFGEIMYSHSFAIGDQFFACAVNESRLFQYFQLSMPDMSLKETYDVLCQGGEIYLNTRQQLLVFDLQPAGFILSFIQITNNGPISSPNYLNYTGGYPMGYGVLPNTAIIGVNLLNNQFQSEIIQLSIGNEKAAVVDRIQVPSEYFVYGEALTSIDSSSNSAAIPIRQVEGEQNYGLLLAFFD